jgi:hypothetical protein
MLTAGASSRMHLSSSQYDVSRYGKAPAATASSDRPNAHTSEGKE